jgi:hypothetical protein
MTTTLSEKKDVKYRTNNKDCKRLKRSEKGDSSKNVPRMSKTPKYKQLFTSFRRIYK